MKKLLLATTMLVTAGTYAAADVSVSGDARMGVVSSDSVMTFKNRVRIKFSGSGTTDGGMSFGGSFRAADAGGAGDGNKGSTYISGGFGKISMGDVDSGDNVGQLASVGYTGLDSGNSISYSADAGGDNGIPGDYKDAGGARVLYSYSTGPVTVNASSAQLTDGGATAYGLGVIYAAGNLTVGAGYGTVEGGTLGVKFYDGAHDNLGGTADQDVAKGYRSVSIDDASVTDATVSVTYAMGDTTVKGIYQQKTLDASSDAVAASGTTVATYVHKQDALDVSASVNSMGLSVTHKLGAITLAAYGISSELDGDTLGTETATVSRYGIGATYDLGGGATIGGGWASVDKAKATANDDSKTAADGDVQLSTVTSETINEFDLGVNFSF